MEFRPPARSQRDGERCTCASKSPGTAKSPAPFTTRSASGGAGGAGLDGGDPPVAHDEVDVRAGGRAGAVDERDVVDDERRPGGLRGGQRRRQRDERGRTDGARRILRRES